MNEKDLQETNIFRKCIDGVKYYSELSYKKACDVYDNINIFKEASSHSLDNQSTENESDTDEGVNDESGTDESESENEAYEGEGGLQSNYLNFIKNCKESFHTKFPGANDRYEAIKEWLGFQEDSNKTDNESGPSKAKESKTQKLKAFEKSIRSFIFQKGKNVWNSARNKFTSFRDKTKKFCGEKWDWFRENKAKKEKDAIANAAVFKKMKNGDEKKTSAHQETIHVADTTNKPIPDSNMSKNPNKALEDKSNGSSTHVTIIICVFIFIILGLFFFGVFKKIFKRKKQNPDLKMQQTLTSSKDDEAAFPI